jgi:hypothetical protein
MLTRIKYRIHLIYSRIIPGKNIKGKEIAMGKIRMWNKDNMKAIVFISILSFAGMSPGADGDEDLLKEAKQIFSPPPKRSN